MDKNNLCDIETGLCMPADVNIKNHFSEKTNYIEKKAKLIYYYDALCGWCYGFSNVIAQVNETYNKDLEIEVISGGLFLGNRVGYVNDVAPHIKSGAYKSVEAMTGVKFGEDFLKDVFGAGRMTLNSLWSSIALCVVKDKTPNKQLEFAEILLHAIYWDGMDTIDVKAIANCATKIGYDKNEFEKLMNEPQYKLAAESEFKNYKSNGIRGMPTLVLETKGHKITLSNGYASFLQLKQQLDAYIK